MVPLIIRRIVNRVGRPFGINPFPRAFEYEQVEENRAGAFEEIYKDNFWGSAQSRSGVGSELEFTQRYREELAELIREKKFKTLFDAPCGDLNWMPELLKEVSISYRGGDISASLVETLQQRQPGLNIGQFDICHDAFPQADVWHCRDCLFHLPFADIEKALRNFIASDIPYALLTTHRAFLLHRNLDIGKIGFRFLDLERAPFFLPKPLAYLRDYTVGSDFPRYVGLWSREMIAEALARQKEKQRILYLVDASTAVTGAFIAARNEARALKELRRIVLVLPNGSAIPKAELTDFARVEYLPIMSLSKNIPAILKYIPALFYSALRLRWMMHKDGATQLQLNDFFLMHGAVMRLLGFNGRILQWVRCDPARFAGFLAQPMLKLARRSADRIIAVSEFVRALLPAAYVNEVVYDYYAGKVRAPKTWNTEEEKTFVYIGNYIRGKGQDVALKAFFKIAAQDKSLKLAFYGGDMGLQKNREYRKELLTMAERSGFGVRVRFGDFAADTFALLESAFAALNFSDRESFSMTVLEASGAGVPVIATKSGGPQEIIKEDETGYLIDVGDVDAAAEQMLTLARDPYDATAMAQAAAAHITQHFSEETFRATLQSLLKF